MFILTILSVVFSLRIQKNVAIADLQRTVDLTTHTVKIQSAINFKNDGIVPLEKIYHIVPNSIHDYLYYIVCEQDGQDIDAIQIDDLDAKIKHNATVYEFTIRQTSTKVTISEYYIKRFAPLPKQIKLEDDQFLKFSDSIYLYSPYEVGTQTTQYITQKIISYSNKDAIERGNVVEYGPYENVRPYQQQFTTLHIENNSPLVIFKKVEMTVEVSHWGNINIEEHYNIENEGALLKGEFGRVSFNKYNPQVGKHGLKQMNAVIPFDSWGVYYRDEIGNISTSNAVKGKLQGESHSIIYLRPRFAILGGWRSNFTLGYNLPTKKHLENEDDQYTLTLNFGFGVREIVAEEYVLKVILPEGVYDTNWKMPVEVEYSEELTFSYLDTEGRPTYVFHKHLLSQFDQDVFKINYKFSKWQILREPLMILSVFVVIFALIIYLRRLELVTLKLKD